MFTKIKKGYYFTISPLIVLFVIGIFYAVFSIFPFGENTISWCDMNQQTIPLLMNLKDIIEENGSVFYSTGNAGGMNFWGVFLFFLSSPMYLAVIFVEKSQIIYLVNILFAVKLALSSLTASVYFNKSHKKLKKEFVIVLSVMYGLCGYGIMYCQTLVWLDIMALFPLLLLSVERLCIQKKPLMYGIILILTVAVNFYLSFMIALYLMLAVPVFIGLRCRKTERKRMAMLFLGTSLIAALITAPIWLCAFLQILNSARGDMFYEVMYKPFFENTGNKLTVIMCTSFGIAVLPVFIKNKISKYKKIKYHLIMLAFLTVPVFIDPVNKMWHMGSYQSFPLRYGFIIIFTLLVLAACYLENASFSEKSSKGFVFTLFLMAALFISSSVIVVYSKREQLKSYTDTLRIDADAFEILFVLSAFACIIYIICINFQRKKLLGSRMLSLIFLTVFLGESVVSLSVNIGYAVNDGGILKSSAVLESDKNNEPYYRTKTEKKYLHVNMLGGLGYNSLAHYTSLTNEDYMFAMKKLGYSSYWMEVGSNGGTALTDALLAVKKSIGAYYDFKSYYDINLLKGDLEIGENSICCPVGIISEKSPDLFRELGNGSRVDVQKALAENFLDSSSMIYEYKPDFTAGGRFKYENDKYSVSVDEETNGFCQMRYSVNISGKQTLYFDVFDNLSNNLAESYYNAVTVYVDGNPINSGYPSQKNNGIITLGEFENTTAEILVIFKKDISVKSLGVFGIDTDKLKSFTDRINGCDFYVEGRNLSAECESEKEQYLYMSIPYEKGLAAYINGEKTEIIRTNDAFCAIKLEKGKNEIKLEFIPYGMHAAIILTVSGILLSILLRKKVINKNNETKFRCPESFALKANGVIFGIVLFAVYIIPVIIRLSIIVSEIIS